tara:strand:- start:80 stop:631 length:552 start_codon:yes stop_codon:yes gene_type:complete
VEGSSSKKGDEESDPLVKLFPPQRTRAREEGEKLFLWLFGCKAIGQSAKLEKLILCPSTLLRAPAVRSLCIPGVLADAEILSIIRNMKHEQTIRHFIHECVRSRRIAVLEELFPDFVIMSVGADAAVNMIHTLSSDEVVKHLRAISWTLPTDRLSAEEQNLHKFWRNLNMSYMRQPLKLWRYG